MLLQIILGYIVFLIIIYPGYSVLVSSGKDATASLSNSGDRCLATDGNMASACRAITSQTLSPYTGSYIRLDLSRSFNINRIVIWPMDAEKNLATGFVVYSSVSMETPLANVIKNFGSTTISTYFECNISSIAVRIITLYKYYIQEDLVISEIEVFTADEINNPTNSTTFIPAFPNSLTPPTPTVAKSSTTSTPPPSALSTTLTTNQPTGSEVPPSESSHTLNASSIGLIVALSVSVLANVILAVVVVCLAIKLKKMKLGRQPVAPKQQLPRFSKMSKGSETTKTNNSYMPWQTPEGTVKTISDKSMTSNTDTLSSGSFLQPSAIRIQPGISESYVHYENHLISE